MGFFPGTGYILLRGDNKKKTANMSLKEEPKLAIRPEDAEVDALDGGWDPYVASLILSQGQILDERDDSEPVRSFSRMQSKRER
jgi:hypothetical protein